MTDEMATWLNMERNNQGWSLREVARRVGVSHTTIVKLANGEGTPSIKLARAIAAIFGVPYENVLRLAGILPPESPLRVVRSAGSPRVLYRTAAEGGKLEDELLHGFRSLDAWDQELVMELVERLCAPLVPRIVGEPPETRK